MARRPVRQAGGIVTKGRRGALRVLLITAKNRPRQWVIPKGHIEEDERPSEAALREVEEEAGVRGALGGYLGRYSYPYGKRRVLVQCYLVRALGRARQREGRRYRWLAFDDALRQLAFPRIRSLLARNRARITAGGNGPRPRR